MNKKQIYWLCQVSGWLIFVALNFLFIPLEEKITFQAISGLIVSFFSGIIISHLYRNLIIRFGWLRFGFLKLAPRFLLASFLLAVFYYLVYFSFTSLFIRETLEFPEGLSLLADILNITFVFLVWSLIYFLFNYIENYKKEEIKNLRWEASKNEVELNRLKSQLNPHFMFNSMNSIRALVDENPAKAKNAITQLSHILRTTLQMGKLKLISFDEELALVKDYLDLEAIRYEERLKVEFRIDPGSSAFRVPPLMIQTIVENAIKHGISKLMQGGGILLETKVTGHSLHIVIINDGRLQQEKEATSGYGIKNTVQRLNLLFGDDSFFKISNFGENKVRTEIKIPKNYEGIDH